MNYTSIQIIHMIYMQSNFNETNRIDSKLDIIINNNDFIKRR